MLIHSEDRKLFVFFLREDGGPLYNKGKCKCVLTNKIVFLNRDLGRQLGGDKVSSHKLFLEGHISVLSFSDDFGSQAMLSCAVLSSQAHSSPGPHWLEHSQLQLGPTAGQPPGRGQNWQSLFHKLFSAYPNTEAQPGPVPAWEEVSRLGWACVGALLLSSNVALASHQVCV